MCAWCTVSHTNFEVMCNTSTPVWSVPPALPADMFGSSICSIYPSIHLFIYPSCLPPSPHFRKWGESHSALFTPSFSSSIFQFCSSIAGSKLFLLFVFSLLALFLSHSTIFFKSLWLLLSAAFLLYVYGSMCERTNTHISVGLCCLTAIHHHFISLNWMPSGPLKLHISSLTNSCSLHTQRNAHRNTPNTQTRFSLTAPMYAFFSTSEGLGRKKGWWSSWLVYQTEGNGVWLVLILSVLSFLPSREKQERRLKGERG